MLTLWLGSSKLAMNSSIRFLTSASTSFWIWLSTKLRIRLSTKLKICEAVNNWSLYSSFKVPSGLARLSVSSWSLVSSSWLLVACPDEGREPFEARLSPMYQPGSTKTIICPISGSWVCGSVGLWVGLKELKATPIVLPALVAFIPTPGMSEEVITSPALISPFIVETLTGTRPAIAIGRGFCAWAFTSAPIVFTGDFDTIPISSVWYGFLLFATTETLRVSFSESCSPVKGLSCVDL